MDGETRCVCCGARIHWPQNHHCPPTFEARMEVIDRREREPHIHVFSEAERLSYGFHLMEVNERF